MAASETPKDDRSLVDVIDTIIENTQGETVSIDELIKVLGRASFGPLFVIVSLIAVLPTGAIPGMSILTGTVMLILSVQLLIGHNHIWLPQVLRQRGMPRKTLLDSLERARGPARRVSRFVGPRLEFLANPPLIQMVAVAGIIVSLTMYPLALVPFGAFPAGLSLLIMGVGLAVRDGLLLIVSAAIGVSSLAVVYYAWPF